MVVTKRNGAGRRTRYQLPSGKCSLLPTHAKERISENIYSRFPSIARVIWIIFALYTNYDTRFHLQVDSTQRRTN